MERKRQHLEVRDMEERKRKREAEIEQEEQKSLEKEWAKNFEVNSFNLYYNTFVTNFSTLTIIYFVSYSI